LPRDARLWQGIYLDGFIYPTATLHSSDPDLMKLLGGRVLVDDRGLAGALLERMASLDRQGPPPLRESEQRMRRVWAAALISRRTTDITGCSINSSRTTTRSAASGIAVPRSRSPTYSIAHLRRSQRSLARSHRTRR
jgi:hypothetical protein